MKENVSGCFFLNTVYINVFSHKGGIGDRCCQSMSALTLTEIDNLI